MTPQTSFATKFSGATLAAVGFAGKTVVVTRATLLARAKWEVQRNIMPCFLLITKLFE